MEIKKKACVGCGRELPLDTFGKHANSRDGYYVRCLDCRDARRASMRREWETRERRYREDMHNVIEAHKENLFWEQKRYAELLQRLGDLQQKYDELVSLYKTDVGVDILPPPFEKEKQIKPVQTAAQRESVQIEPVQPVPVQTAAQRELAEYERLYLAKYGVPSCHNPEPVL
jgi:hypothetical protein